VERGQLAPVARTFGTGNEETKHFQLPDPEEDDKDDEDDEDEEDEEDEEEEEDEIDEVDLTHEEKYGEETEFHCVCWEHGASNGGEDISQVEGNHVENRHRCVPSEFDRSDLIAARQAWEFHHACVSTKMGPENFKNAHRSQYWSLHKVPKTSKGVYRPSVYKENCYLDYRDWPSIYEPAPKARCFCFVCTPEVRAHANGAKFHYYHECEG